MNCRVLRSCLGLALVVPPPFRNRRPLTFAALCPIRNRPREEDTEAYLPSPVDGDRFPMSPEQATRSRRRRRLGLERDPERGKRRLSSPRLGAPSRHGWTHLPAQTTRRTEWALRLVGPAHHGLNVPAPTKIPTRLPDPFLSPAAAASLSFLLASLTSPPPEALSEPLPLEPFAAGTNGGGGDHAGAAVRQGDGAEEAEAERGLGRQEPGAQGGQEAASRQRAQGHHQAARGVRHGVPQQGARLPADEDAPQGPQAAERRRAQLPAHLRDPHSWVGNPSSAWWKLSLY
jgi:hypothetical protein